MGDINRTWEIVHAQCRGEFREEDQSGGGDIEERPHEMFTPLATERQISEVELCPSIQLCWVPRAKEHRDELANQPARKPN
jgi:hypothetical protein